MVGHHVTQSSGLVVVTAPLFHADRFGHRDLHMINVAAVPDRLENSVGEAERQDVLNSLFAQVMIDAIDLLLPGNVEELLVKRLRRFQIMPKRLLDDYPPPLPVVFLHEAN